MAVHVDVRQAQATLNQMASRFTAEQIARATARAINHTTAKAKTEVAKAIKAGSKQPVKSKDVKKRIKQVVAYAHKIELGGKLVATSKPTPIIDLNADEGLRGVYFDGPKGRVLVKSAFIQKMPKTGHVGVFARVSGNSANFKFRHTRIKKGYKTVNGKKVPESDLRLRELHTMSTSQQALSQGPSSVMISVVKKGYVGRLLHEMQQMANGVTT